MPHGGIQGTLKRGLTGTCGPRTRGRRRLRDTIEGVSPSPPPWVQALGGLPRSPYFFPSTSTADSTRVPRIGLKTAQGAAGSAETGFPPAQFSPILRWIRCGIRPGLAGYPYPCIRGVSGKNGGWGENGIRQIRTYKVGPFEGSVDYLITPISVLPLQNISFRRTKGLPATGPLCGGWVPNWRRLIQG